MYCRTEYSNIYYETIGAGKPVVMIHGFTPDHRLMSGCMEPVFTKRDGYKRIYVDLPGMGKSDAPASIDSSDRMLEEIIAFIDKVIPNENFLLAGESYGGYLARGIVSRMNKRVDGLLLICPVVIAEGSRRDLPSETIVLQDRKFTDSLSPEVKDNFCGSFVIQNEYTFRRFQNEILSGVEVSNQDFLGHMWEKYAFSFDVDSMGGKFEKPVLLLTGRQDACVGYRDLWSIIESFPRASFAVLDGAGHNLQIEQPELFSSLVDEWITRTERKNEN